MNGPLGWLDRKLFPAPEGRSIDKGALFARGEDIGDPVHAGVFVSQGTAMRLAAVYRCINLIAGSMASLPADVVRKRGEIREPVERPPAWLEQPNPLTNGYELKERIQESLLIDGNAFLLITARDAQGFPAELWTLNPREIVVEQAGRTVSYRWEITSPPTRLSRFGVTNPLGDVLHIKLNGAGGSRGMSPLTDVGKQAIGLSLVTEKFGSKFFGQGANPNLHLGLPPAEQGGIKATKEYVDLIREQVAIAHSGSGKSHGVLVTAGGVTLDRLTIEPEHAQFLETRKFQVEDIARLFGVPGFLVGLEEKNTSWGTGIESISNAFLRFTLMPHIIRMETALSTLLPRGQFYRLNTKAMLRPDAAAEANILQTELQNGVINFDEWRALKDLPPRPGGNRFMVPANMKVLESNGVPAAPPPALTVAPEDNNNDAGA